MRRDEKRDVARYNGERDNANLLREFSLSLSNGLTFGDD